MFAVSSTSTACTFAPLGSVTLKLQRGYSAYFGKAVIGVTIRNASQMDNVQLRNFGNLRDLFLFAGAQTVECALSVELPNGTYVLFFDVTDNLTAVSTDTLASLFLMCLQIVRSSEPLVVDSVAAVLPCLLLGVDVTLRNSTVLFSCEEVKCSPCVNNVFVDIAYNGNCTNDSVLICCAVPKLRFLTIRGCHRLESFDVLLSRPCTTLERFDCSDTKIRDISALAGGAPNLTHLWLRFCRQLSNISSIRHLKLLRLLDISQTIVRDLIFLGEMKTIEILICEECATIQDFSPIFGCVSLTVLNVARTAICDLFLVGNLPLLQDLSLCGCSHLSDFSSLAACSSLRSLHVSDTNISVGQIELVAALPWLSSLRMKNCAQVPADAALWSKTWKILDY